VIAAHDQLMVHRYTVHYPAHEPREKDPHYAELREFKRRRKAAGTYYCDWGHAHYADECDTSHPLEAHHSVIEDAMFNEVDMVLLERDYPGISAPGVVGAWLDGEHNLMLLCRVHHRSAQGVHTASASDFEAESYVRRLIT